jgi:hypothetical protein
MTQNNMKNLLALCAFLLLNWSVCLAQIADREHLEKKIEELRLLLISPEQKELENITSSHLTYGHSNGRIENQQEFIAYLLSGVSKFVTIDLQNQTVDIIEDIGVVRHTIIAETNNEGKTVHIKIGVLLVWQKEGDEWRLLARQAFKF